MKVFGYGLILLFLFAIFSVMVLAPTTNTTVMTWIVPSNKSHTIEYGGTCTASLFYFPENKGEDSDVDGNSARILPYPDSAGTGTACQSAASNGYGMRITNNGNVAINLDANFQLDFNSSDTNIELKVWMGTGSGCGTAGFGGWQRNCTILGSNPVTSSACRDFNSTNETTTARLVTNLAVNDTNELCFSGEMTCGNDYQYSSCLGHGGHPQNFDTNAS